MHGLNAQEAAGEIFTLYTTLSDAVKKAREEENALLKIYNQFNRLAGEENSKNPCASLTTEVDRDFIQKIICLWDANKNGMLRSEVIGMLMAIKMVTFICVFIIY